MTKAKFAIATTNAFNQLDAKLIQAENTLG